MEAQLILFPTENILINFEKPKSNDVVYINNDIYHHEIRRYTTAFDNFNLKDCFKVIASDNPKYEVEPINYNGLENKFGITNTEKLSDEWLSNIFNLDSIDYSIAKQGFLKGFKKAQELNSRKFDLDDIEYAYNQGHNVGVFLRDERHDEMFKETVEHLQKPKKFDVIIKKEKEPYKRYKIIEIK